MPQSRGQIALAGLRFIHYIGPWVGAVLPIVMSLATSDGWWQPLAVIGYVLVLELACNNAVEPLVFGHSTGVSPAALLISAAFWLYLLETRRVLESRFALLSREEPAAVVSVALGLSNN